jgi:hypothetical protein
MGTPSGAELVEEAYGALARVLGDCDEELSWAPTACLGWAVRDLAFHCLTDAQRALVALHTPTSQTPDRDAVTYWRDWSPDAVGAANGRRFVRVAASMFLKWDELRELYLDTSAAVTEAAAAAPPSRLVRTQGHVLTADDLARTLCVEATIHHLDLVDGLGHRLVDRGPTASGLAEVRRVLDGLVGHPVALGWTDGRYARVATGRARATPDEARSLGPVLDRFPLFS